ncbi:YibE/F family protein [Nocardioides coralli]|uniref:YibE/F family protein n=1 Tax=Nocardioides coralli TaxID=2872154 RepID=UPI001CA39187|nr:YibE/F family protein [Nocardioides coralli]QZY29392.1 YibE/F family protein [Nocardioides coralli]
MSHEHRHAPADPSGTPRHVQVVLAAVIAPLVVATVAGLVLLWPSEAPPTRADDLGSASARGSVVSVEECGRGQAGCRARVAVSAGEGAGSEVDAFVPFGPGAPEVEVGDDLILSYVGQAPPGERYSFQDFDRRQPLLWLSGLFVVAVVLLSRWRGVASLVSLGFSLLVLTTFTLPAIVGGGPPLPIAIVTAATIMVVTLYLSHGVTTRTSVAMVGTLLALVLIGVVGSVFTRLGDFTGLGDEGSQYIAAVASGIDLSGLLLAGLVIGALGVLDDVTVTQAAAVWELADAEPSATRRSVFARAMRIGRSHAASTVNTLVLAYVGATLPLLLIFSVIELPFGVAVSQELVAQEIVRGLVGGLGILAAIPLTTAIASVAAVVRTGAEREDRPAG